MLISMPTGNSTIFGAFQLIAVSSLGDVILGYDTTVPTWKLGRDWPQRKSAYPCVVQSCRDRLAQQP